MAAPSSTADPGDAPFRVVAVPAAEGPGGLRLEGELDLGGIAALEAAAAELPPDAPAVIDLRELAFMDSSGVAAIIRLDQRLRETGGSVRCLVAAEGPVRKVVDLTQLGELLEVVVAPAGPETGVDRGDGG